MKLFLKLGQFEICSAERNHLKNMVKGHKRTIYFVIWQLAYEDMLLKDFSTFDSGSHFVQPSRTILAIFVKGV